MRTLTLCVVVLFAAVSLALAAAEDKSAQDERAIRQTIDSYVDAFNRGDATALAAHWTEEGLFITPTGEEFAGRKRLEDAFKTFFSESKGIKLAVKSLAIYLESPTEAIEEGVATTRESGEEPESTRYVAWYVKRNGAWKIAKLREILPLQTPSHYDELKALEWMIGDWVDKDESGALESRCFWSKNRNFLVRSFSLTVDEQNAFEGTQVIGWDPASKQIRSWVFDSNGGFGEGVWSKQGKSWHVNSMVVLNTGEKASSINILTPLDENSYTWQSTGREVAGELLPNTPKVTVVRKRTDAAEDSSSAQ